MKMLAFFRNIWFSFPWQIVLIHLRYNLLLAVLWIILFGFLFGYLGSSLGCRFFFLDAEYLGEVGFAGYTIIGFTMGMFYLSWNTTTYILNSKRFPFLASLNRPYFKYSINNFLIPLLFIFSYVFLLIQFQWFNEFAPHAKVVFLVLGLVLGFSMALGMSFLYFKLTNSDIDSIQNAFAWTRRVQKKFPFLNAKADIDHFEFKRKAVRVETYLTETLSTRVVRDVSHYNAQQLSHVFRQNHLNMLLIQALIISILIMMGYLVQISYFRIPTAASLFILMSVITNLMGALTFWLNEWRTIAIIVILISFDALMKGGYLNFTNPAYGLDYSVVSPYSYKRLEEIASIRNYYKDASATLSILNRWRFKFTSKDPSYKPKMVVLCFSGGGVRSALWTTAVLQELDAKTKGKIFKNAVLMTGASGGMWGAAYMRELYRKKISGEKIQLQDSIYQDNISKDLLNGLAFTYIVNDLLMPWVQVSVTNRRYIQDRGFVWEQNFNENTNAVLDHDLKFYKEQEETGRIPMMFLTPTIINDSRFLVVSPHRVSYMMKPPFAFEGDVDFSEIDAVDFCRLTEKNDPLSLRFSTALRMNSTFPLIFPNVQLPTSPKLEIMDAGLRDNFGIESAVRFLATFRSWIRENTSGVLILSIRGSKKIDDINPVNNPGLGSAFFSPLSAILDIDNVQDYHHDGFVSFLQSKLGYSNVDLIHLVYKQTTLEQKASLSLHLTKREKNDILSAINIPSNQKALKKISKSIY